MEWSNNKVALLIVFDIWSYEYNQIKRILESRSIVTIGFLLSDYNTVSVYQISIKAIQEQFKKVRSENSQLWRRGSGWNRETVAVYFCELSVDRGILELNDSDIASMF